MTFFICPFGSFGRPTLRFFSFILHLRDYCGFYGVLPGLHWGHSQNGCVLGFPVVILVRPCVTLERSRMTGHIEDFTSPSQTVWPSNVSLTGIVEPCMALQP